MQSRSLESPLRFFREKVHLRKALLHAFSFVVAASAAVSANAQQSQYSAGGVQGFGNAKAYRESAASKAPLAKFACKQQLCVGIRTDGTLIQWGGTQSAFNSELPIGTTRAIAVAVGYYHALYQKPDGTLGAWGQNFYGQATVPATLGKVISFDGGASHSVAVKENGTVVAWGVTATQTSVPAGLSGVVQVAAGQSHNVALKSDGTVVCWGNNTNGQIDVPSGLSDVIQVDAAENTSAALKSDGTVVVWGNTTNGHNNIPAGLSGVVKIAIGPRNVVALKSDGKIEVWGSNTYQANNVPAGLSNVADIEVGAYSTQALKADGTQVAWGNFDYYPPNFDPLIDISGNAGNSNPRFWVGLTASGKPVVYGSATTSVNNVPASITGAKKIVAGTDFVAVIKQDGTIGAWGSSTTTVPSRSNVIDIAAGSRNAIALQSDGTVTVWGSNTYGQVTVPTEAASGVVQVAAGEGHCVVLKSDGTVFCWGLNDQGQSTVPAGLTGVVKIAASDRHTLAVKSDGTVVTWGSNSYSENTIPTGLNDAVNAASGTGHYLVLRSDGTVAKWGNAFGGANYTLNGVGGIVKIAASDASWCLPNVYLSLSAAKLTSLKSMTATLTLPIAPGSGGADVTIATDSVGTSAPGTVHVDAGAHTATFPIYGESVVADKVVFISATYQGNTIWAAVTVTPRADTPSAVEISPNTVVGGSTAAVNGKVVLGATATEDITVSLTSNDPLVSVPASVQVPMGSTEATFPISHNPTATPKTVTITGSFGQTASGTLNLTSGMVSGLTLTVPSVKGGTTVTGRISMNSAFNSNITVALSSDSGAASVPATVEIPAGSTYADFTITTHPQASNAVAKITATYAESTVSEDLTIQAPRLVSISVPESIYGLQIRTGTVTLDGAAPDNYTVSLASNSGALTVTPVTFSTGSKNGSFSMTTGDPTSATNVTLTASLSGETRTAAITVTPNTIKSLTLSVASIQAGTATPLTATIRLASPPDFPTFATLTASDIEGSLSVPATVSISTSGVATFNVSHKMVGDFGAGLITAKRLGKTVATSVTLNPNAFTLTINRATVYGGSTAEISGKVKLKWAVAEDTYLKLSSDQSSAASVPATVLIPAGQKIGVFTVTHEDVATSKTVNVTASRGLATSTAPLTVTPILVVSHTVTPTSVENGATEVLATVTLQAAPREDMVVELTSKVPTIVSVPATVTVRAGELTATYQPTVLTAVKTKSVPLKATHHGVTKTCSLTVSPP